MKVAPIRVKRALVSAERRLRRTIARRGSRDVKAAYRQAADLVRDLARRQVAA